MADSNFALSIERFCLKTKLRSDVVVRRIAFDIFSRVVLRTPVDTGRARANWQISIGSMPVGTVSGTTGYSTQFAKIQQFQVGQVIYMANNLPYIGVLEYGGYPNPSQTGIKTIGGYSIQAPHGMVGVTMTEVEAIYTRATKEESAK